jgi:hypothetical protein
MKGSAFSMRRRNLLFLCACLLAATVLAGGCGGAGAPGTTRTATAQFSVHWPDLTRSIPVTAVRVQIEAFTGVGAQPIGSAVASRTPGDASGATSQLTINNLPVGSNVRFEIKAFGDPTFAGEPGGGAPVASATVSRVLEAGPNTVSVVLDSRIDMLRIVPETAGLSGSGTPGDPYLLIAGITEVPLRVEALDTQRAIVLLRYNPVDRGANPQLAWSLSSQPSGLATLDRTLGVDVELAVPRATSGDITVSVTYQDIATTQQPQPRSVSTSVSFRVSLRTESQNLFVPGVAAPGALSSADPVDIAARVDVEGRGDEIFVLGGRPAGSAITAATVTIPQQNSTPQFGAATNYTIPSLGLTRIARHGDPFGFLATDGGVRVYTFKRFPSNTLNLAPERTLDFAATPLGLSVGGIDDIDALDSQTSFYLLFHSGSGNLQVARVNAAFGAADIQRQNLQSGASSGPRRLAVLTEESMAGPTFFVLDNNVVSRYVGTSAAPSALTIPTSPSAENPSGEVMGQIRDIACSNTSLYVLADTARGPRVHIFNSDGTYSRSRLVDNDNNLATPIRIRALVSSVGTSGSNDIYVAYLDESDRPAVVAATER